MNIHLCIEKFEQEPELVMTVTVNSDIPGMEKIVASSKVPDNSVLGKEMKNITTIDDPIRTDLFIENVKQEGDEIKRDISIRSATKKELDNDSTLAKEIDMIVTNMMHLKKKEMVAETKKKVEQSKRGKKPRTKSISKK